MNYAKLVLFLAGLPVMAQDGFRLTGPPGAVLEANKEAAMRVLEVQGPQLVKSPPAFACTTVTRRSHGVRSRIEIDLTPAPARHDLGSVDGEAIAGSALSEVFTDSAEAFRVVSWRQVKLKLQAVAERKDGAREATVYIDSKLGTIDSAVLLGYPTPEGVAGMKCWAIERR